MKKDLTVLLQMFPELASMQNQSWAQAAISIWDEVLERSSWKTVQDARFSIGADEISLLGHTRAVLNHALNIADSLKMIHGREVPLDREALMIGCILHDVDKLLALAPDGKGGCIPTEIGYDFQHGFYGAYYAEKAGLPAAIVTMIINHTAVSRMMPNTLEGVTLYFADMADNEVVKFTYGHVPTIFQAIGKLPGKRGGV